MKEHGVASSWFEYMALPYGIIEDCRLLQNYEAQRQKLTKATNAHG